MGTWSSPSSLSSSTSFTSCYCKNKIRLFGNFSTWTRKAHSSLWVFQIGPKTPFWKHFQLKSSNGHPLNAVSSDDGWFLFDSSSHPLSFNCLFFMCFSYVNLFFWREFCESLNSPFHTLFFLSHSLPLFCIIYVDSYLSCA